MSRIFLPALLFLLLPGVGAARELTRADMGARLALMESGVPMIKSWAPAAAPADAPLDEVTGSAVVRVIVNAQGRVETARVLSASAGRMGAAALEAARQWTFEPPVVDGKPAPLCLDIPFENDLALPKTPGVLPPERLLPKPAPVESAALLESPLGEYPPALVGRGIPGDVNFHGRVLADGRGEAIRVLYASHADFVLPALEASPGWRFRPAMQGDIPVGSEFEGVVIYRDTKAPTRSHVLAANGMSGPDGNPPEFLPFPVVVADPVWPMDALLAGQGGSATVEFVVTEAGVVRDVRIHEATHTDFGHALAAAMECCRFEPALAAGRGTSERLRRTYQWKPVPADAPPDSDDWLTRLTARLRAKAVRGGKGLDERLAPLYRVAPERPQSAAEGEKAEAVVEFVVDRDGRARLPRVISATRPEFGWAAATAASQWLFKAPTRGGQPTEVIVQVPFGF